MLRCTIELLPRGDESRARVIGLVEITNIGGTADRGNYAVVLKKTPPFAGALKAAWKKGMLRSDGGARIDGVECSESDEVITEMVEGHHRTRRGSYDLLFRALRACRLAERNPVSP